VSEGETPKVSAPMDGLRLPSDWTMEYLSLRRSLQEETMPLEDPNPLRNPDAYTLAQIEMELSSLQSAEERLALLQAMLSRGCYFSPQIASIIIADKSAKVRVWGVVNLSIDQTDYSDPRNPKEMGSLEPLILGDGDPLVRASIWRNENYKKLPWSMIYVAEDWKSRLSAMSQLERLALMRNATLSHRYIVALLDAPTDDLGMSRSEHGEMLFAAAMNSRLVWSSRHHGRDFWVVEGDANPPFAEYGQMWEIALDKWLDMPCVPYAFLNYIQTTPAVKMQVYQKLLTMTEEHRPSGYRGALIEGCDPFKDKDVLKLAWKDPDEICRKVAEVRVGEYKKWVGVD
jgi:hypothetical protein